MTWFLLQLSNMLAGVIKALLLLGFVVSIVKTGGGLEESKQERRHFIACATPPASSSVIARRGLRRPDASSASCGHSPQNSGRQRNTRVEDGPLPLPQQLQLLG